MEIFFKFLICQDKCLARFSDCLQNLVVLDGLSDELN